MFFKMNIVLVFIFMIFGSVLVVGNGMVDILIIFKLIIFKVVLIS